MTKENISRRDALYIGGTLLGAGLLGGSGLVKQKERSVSEANIVALNSPSEYIFANNNTENAADMVARYEVSVNTDAFYSALNFIAEREEGAKGKSKLQRYLKNSRVNIKLVDDSYEKQFGVRVGTEGSIAYYVPKVWFGNPEIGLRNQAVDSYFYRLIDKSTYVQLQAPECIYHELYHAWQEVRDPVSNTCDLAANNIFNKNFNLCGQRQYVPENEGLLDESFLSGMSDMEKEATLRARELVVYTINQGLQDVPFDFLRFKKIRTATEEEIIAFFDKRQDSE